MTARSVLVIEDHQLPRAAAVAALEGYDVTEAATVGDAFAALALRRPAVVVLDLAMDRPSAGLHATLQALRLPVVVVSGLEAEEARAAADAAGWRCLPKPFTAEALRAVVEELAAPSIVPDLAPPPRATRPMPEVHPPPPTATERPPTPDLPERTPSGAPVDGRDPWRDRLRVVMDRVLYLAGLVVLYRLSLAGKLDVGTTAAVMLVVGVRPHNLFEAATAARSAGGARAAAALLFAPLATAARSGSWLGS